MAYIIQGTDLSIPPIIIENKTVDTSTDLVLLGRNVTDFGIHVDHNFLHLLENFADTAPPPNPLPGQLWFDKTDAPDGKLKVNLTVTPGTPNWQPILNTTVGLQDEVDLIESSLGLMFTFTGAYDATAFTGYNFLTINAFTLHDTLTELDSALFVLEQDRIAATDLLNNEFANLLIGLGSDANEPFSPGDGSFSAGDTGSGLNSLSWLNGAPSLGSLHDVFININNSFDGITATFNTRVDNLETSLETKDFNMIASMGFLFGDGNINIAPLNAINFVTVPAGGTLVDAFESMAVGINSAVLLAANDHNIGSLQEKVRNIEANSLGDMVNGAGNFDNSALVNTNFISTVVNVQEALTVLDTTLNDLAAIDNGAAPQAEIDLVEDKTGFLDQVAALKLSVINGLANVTTPLIATDNFFDAIIQLDGAITAAATSGITELDGDARYLRSAFLEHAENASGSFVKINISPTNALLLQWGSAAPGAVPATQVLPLAYPSTSYSVMVMKFGNEIANRDSFVVSSTPSSFDYLIPGSIITMQWFTIGIIDAIAAP